MLDLAERRIWNIGEEAILEPHHVLREGEIYGPWVGGGGEIGHVDGEGFVSGFTVHVEQRRGWSVGVPNFDDSRGGMSDDTLSACDGSGN